MEPQPDLELGDLALLRRAFGGAALPLTDARLRRRELAAGLRYGELRFAEGPSGAVMPFPRCRERLLRELLRRHGRLDLADAVLVQRQRLLLQLGFPDQNLRPLIPLPELRRLERHCLAL